MPANQPKNRSVVSDSVTPWNVACQAPLSMGFSRQEYWGGLPFISPGDLPDPGIEPEPFASPALAGGFFITSATWEDPFLLHRASFLPGCLFFSSRYLKVLPSGISIPSTLFHSYQALVEFWILSWSSFPARPLLIRLDAVFLSLFKTFIYLAAPDLHCGMWDLVP